MTPQELKNSILQLAIQGKLVEQRPEEGTVEELYRQIQMEKQALIKAGKIKKEKPLPEITEDEIPFEIPENWKWIKLDDLVTKEIKRGKSPVYTTKSGVLVFAQKCNTKAGYIDIGLSLYLDETKLKKYPDSEFMQDMDIVINSTGNGTLGRVGIYQTSDNPNRLPIVPDSHVTVIRANEAMCVWFVYYALKYYQPYMEKLGSGSTNQTELSANLVKELLIPLPPLPEQRRIVAKIEGLLPLIDRYEKAWTRLEDFNKRFPADMQKSILQLAIQGKLVEQRPEEGTGEELYRQIQKEKQALIKAGKIKKEKPLPEITDDEIPFDIPESWKWVRLRDITTKITDGTHHSPPNFEQGTYLYVTAKNIKNSGVQLSNITYVSKETHEEIFSRCNPEKGDILLIKDGATTGVVTVNDLDQPFSMLSSVALIKLTKTFYAWYLVYVLRSDLFYKTIRAQMKGTGITRITLKQIEPLLVPLPPVAEQKRIIAKLEELLPLCEKINKN